MGIKSLVVLAGAWEERADAVLSLLRADFEVVLAASLSDHGAKDTRHRPVALLAVLNDTTPPGEVAAMAKSLETPWIAWNASGRTETAEAYKAGAIAVLGDDLSVSDLGQVVRNALLRLARPQDNPSVSVTNRSYRAGERIDVRADHVLQIHEGVVSLHAVHPDGAEVLLGLLGPGQFLAGHPMDSCYVEVQAHTSVTVSRQSWAHMRTETPTAMMDAMRAQLLQMQGWASMQARPNLSQRTLGILSLLAEQFGIADAQGALIDVRLTHSQIAAAVGATRTTVTRILGELERDGKLRVVGAGANARLWVQGPITVWHCPHA